MRDATDNTIAALELARLGYRITPLRSSLDRMIPAFGAWRDEYATSDAATIRLWWEEDPRRGIAWRVPDGVVRVDIDVRDEVDGYRTLAALANAHGSLPATRTIATPRGGQHRYYRVVAGALSAGVRQVAAGVEVLAGRWAPLPPTRRRAGAYRWLSGRTAPVPLLPSWVPLIANATARAAGNGSCRPRSTFGIDLDELLAALAADREPAAYRLRSGEIAERWGSIRCPNPAHLDRHASAYVIRFPNGAVVVGCSVCSPAEVDAAVREFVR